MRFLVLATNYPSNENKACSNYIHTRNLYYQAHGIDVDVLNFASSVGYEIDGIKVYSLSDFKNKLLNLKYDLLVSHASNLRNHYRFLLKFGGKFLKIVFFYHGHEVLKINQVYSKPYPFVNRSRVKELFQDIYDSVKLFVWRHYINSHYQKLYHVFVSHWMKDEFMRWVHPESRAIEGRTTITYNSVGELFEKESYDKTTPKKFDFITIRSVLDGSKYAVDIVNDFAKKYADKNFLLIGKGTFFNHYEKAPNITWINNRISHAEMLDLLNASKCALMPTRTDAQGVMMCEMATFGLPLITSDIPVCHEVFDGFSGIGLISNDNYLSCDINAIYDDIKTEAGKNERYFYSKVMAQELAELNKIIEHKIVSMPFLQ